MLQEPSSSYTAWLEWSSLFSTAKTSSLMLFREMLLSFFPSNDCFLVWVKNHLEFRNTVWKIIPQSSYPEVWFSFIHIARLTKDIIKAAVQKSGYRFRSTTSKVTLARKSSLIRHEEETSIGTRLDRRPVLFWVTPDCHNESLFFHCTIW